MTQSRRVPWLLLPATCGVLAVGCMGLNVNRTPPPPIQGGPLYNSAPTTEEIVRYLNRTAATVSSLECRDLDIDIKADTQSVGVHGSLYCQKPRNFRLRAKKPVFAADAADFGSNDREFWYWTYEDKDLYHCSYSDLARGNVRVPFPLHPDWMLEALGIGAPAPIGTPEQEQANGRTLKVEKSSDNKYIHFYEQTTSLQGQKVTKVTRLNNFDAKGSTPQVVGHYLYDYRTQQMICQATMVKVQYDAASGTIVPQRIDFEWPAMKLSLSLTLDKVLVNNADIASNTRLFTRPHIPNVRDVDLAQGGPIMSPTGIQRAGAFR
jgi:hypothetical protein